MARKKSTESLRTSGILDILDRMTRAEERVVHMDERQEEWRAETRAAHADVSRRLGALEISLHKYQGAWGLLTIFVTALAAAGALLKDFLVKKFS